MSRSKKDGKGGGGHHQSRYLDKEYWSPRGLPCMIPGEWSKHITHRMERREAQQDVEDGLDELNANYDDETI